MIKNSSILKAKTNFLLPFLFSSICFPFILFVRIISFFEKKKGGRERERDRKKLTSVLEVLEGRKRPPWCHIVIEGEG